MRMSLWTVSAGLALLAFSTASHALCPTIADTYVQKGKADTQAGVVSGLATTTYFIQVGMGGGTSGLINLAIQAAPGFQYANGQKGFIGSGSTLYVTYFVPPGAAPGTYRDVWYRVINSAGQTVCSDEFRVNVTP